MAVDRNMVIKLNKSGKSNVEIAKRLEMNRSTVWKIVKKFKETGSTIDNKGRGRKRAIRTLQLIKNMREKLRRILVAVADYCCSSWCEQILQAQSAEKRSWTKTFQNAASP